MSRNNTNVTFCFEAVGNIFYYSGLQNLTDCNNYKGISFLPTTYKILSNILLSRLIPYAEGVMEIINVDSDAIGQLLIVYSVFAKYLRNNGNTKRQCISSL
jgi:hypothetical protein